MSTHTNINDFNGQYNLNDLLNYFDNSNLNETAFRNTNSKTISYDEMKFEFPESIMRNNGYTVYKVNQGGHFYVFFVDSFSSKDNSSKKQSFVYFSAYISCDRDESFFDSLKLGESTAADVKKLDPYLELSFLNSTGVYSYSFLDKDSILQIKYSYKENIESYESLIIEEIIVLPRASVQSRYSTIHNDDLPADNSQFACR